jgi:DNA-binding NarL/FixJ family response regulator
LCRFLNSHDKPTMSDLISSDSPQPTTAADQPSQAMPPWVVLIGGDLLMGSRIAAGFRQAGCRVTSAASLGGCLSRADLPPGQPDLVIIDACAPRVQLAPLAEQLREHFPDAQCITFAAHVQTQRLAEAKQLPLGTVMTRGQFDRQLSQLIEQLAEKTPRSPS